MESTTSHGRHLADNAMQRRITADLDVIFDSLRIDEAAMGANHRQLAREERMIRIALLDAVFATTIEGIDDGSRIRRGDLLVKKSLRFYADHWSLAAKAHAANAPNLNLVTQVSLGHNLFQYRLDLIGLRRDTAGGHAASHANLFAACSCFFREGIEFFKRHEGFLSTFRLPVPR